MHETFMHAALEQAGLGLAAGEVPVGGSRCWSSTTASSLALFNQPIGLVDPTAQRRVPVLRKQRTRWGTYRLTDAVVDATVEPCLTRARACSCTCLRVREVARHGMTSRVPARWSRQCARSSTPVSTIVSTSLAASSSSSAAPSFRNSPANSALPPPPRREPRRTRLRGASAGRAIEVERFGYRPCIHSRYGRPGD